MKRYIYVASSWRNEYQPIVVKFLKYLNHQVYDFRNPPGKNTGFSWKEIDDNWLQWDWNQYQEALKSPQAVNEFWSDFEAMNESNTCVLVLPCGPSAHIEAGWIKGAGKELYIYKPEPVKIKPDLMYKMADRMTDNLHHLDRMLSKMEK